MAIGRSFEETLQKALRMLGVGADGFTAHQNHNFHVPDYEKEIREPTTRRIFALAEALRKGVSPEKLHEWSRIDRWFLEKMANIIDFERSLSRRPLKAEVLRDAKKLGFSDAQIGVMKKMSAEKVRALRIRLGIVPSIKQIDTLAGEFPAKTNYLYLTYHGAEHDIKPGTKPITVLGSGPYCIGSSVEFDWCNVQVLRRLRELKRETVMINCNPETVSTDYDESDRLYFEELSLERVLDIVEFEHSAGVVVSTGGQIPNNLALPLQKAGAHVLGTKPQDIDRAEDRHTFSKLLDKIEVHQPAWTEVTTPQRAVRMAEKMGYPVLVRPSYVLSGSAMNVAFDQEALEKCLKRAADISQDHPVVISKFIENAREIEIDGVAKDGRLAIYAISEHVENAGTHSGDATVVLPPQRTYLETIRRAKAITKRIVKELRITGPFNIQFLAKDNHLMVIECNVRASRSFPFVSKVTGHNFITLVVNAMLGADIAGEYRTVELDWVAVKSPQFSYGRIKGADPVSYVEMTATGEVACFGDSYAEALLLSMQAAGFRIPRKNILVSLGKEENKIKLLPAIVTLEKMGFALFATEGTADFLATNNVPCTKVFKEASGRGPTVHSLLDEGRIELIINIPAHGLVRCNGAALSAGFSMRRRAVDMNVPLITNRQLAEGFINALAEEHIQEPPKSWGEYVR
jgi:carbamoyl-phosphate synthase large subunit